MNLNSNNSMTKSDILSTKRSIRQLLNNENNLNSQTKRELRGMLKINNTKQLTNFIKNNRINLNPDNNHNNHSNDEWLLWL